MAFGSAIVAQIGGSVDQLRAAGSEAVGVAGNIAANISKKFEFRDVGRTLATALGLNLEGIAEKLARGIAGVSKEEEAAFKELEQASTQAADATIAGMRAGLTAAQQLKLVTQDRERLERQIQNTVGESLEKVLERTKLQIDLQKKITEQREAEARAEEEARRANAQFFKDQETTRKTIADFKERNAKDEQDELKKIAEEEEAYLKKSYDLDKQIREQKTASLSIDDQKIVREKELHELQQKQKATAKGTNEYKEYQLQIGEKLNEVTELGRQIAARTAETIKDQGKEAEAVYVKIQSINEAWRDFVVSVKSTGRRDEEMSDRELLRKAGNIRQDIANRSANNSGRSGLVGVDPGFDWLAEQQKMNLAQVMAELNFRRDVRGFSSQFGEDAAFERFGGLSESRFRQILSEIDTREQTQLLRDIKGAIMKGNAQAQDPKPWG